MIERVAKLPLAFEPGTKWQYSIGLDVMGLVIERVSGKRLEDFPRERLFGPLDMASTGFRVEARDASRLTTNYTVTAEGLRPGDPAAASVWLSPPALPAGGAGLVSTERDFWRFGAMFLGDGALRRVRVLKAETARLARSNLLPAGHGVTDPRHPRNPPVASRLPSAYPLEEPDVSSWLACPLPQRLTIGERLRMHTSAARGSCPRPTSGRTSRPARAAPRPGSRSRGIGRRP
jgi:CubicO group peptidase (beta-lactamase class C family)